MTVIEYLRLKFNPISEQQGRWLRYIGQSAMISDELEIDGCWSEDFLEKCVKLSQAVEAWVKDPLPKPMRFVLSFDFGKDPFRLSGYMPHDRVYFRMQGRLNDQVCGSECSLSLYAFEEASFDILTATLDGCVRMMVQAVRNASSKSAESKQLHETQR